MLHVDRRTLQNAVRNILDGELLNRYLYLSTMERSELAKKIGTTPDIVSGPPTPLPTLLPLQPSPPSPAPLPTDPRRPVRDRPCHCPLLDSWTQPQPHPLFVQKNRKDTYWI